MGWTNLHKDPKQSLADFFKHTFTSPSYEVLDVASYLNVSYIALKRPDNTVTAIVCLIMHTPNDHYNFSYKDMDEGMGPYENTCPERILKLLTPTEDKYALAWRTRCYDNLAKKKNAAKVGDVILLSEPLTFTDGHRGDTFKLLQDGRRTYFQDVTTYKLYRITNWKTREYVIVI